MERRTFFGSVIAALASLVFWRTAVSETTVTFVGDDRGSITFLKGRYKSLRVIAREALRIIRENVQIPHGVHWGFDGDTKKWMNGILVGGHCFKLNHKCVMIPDDPGISLTVAVLSFAQGINKEAETALAMGCRPLPAIPSSFGCLSVVASDGRYSIRVVRSYNHRIKGIELSFEMLYGSAQPAILKGKETG